MTNQLAYKQWDDKPTWCLDRGRDDARPGHADDPTPTGFHAALLGQKDKEAQLHDASIAFLTMKKQAGVLGTAMGMAKANPHLAGAAVGAVGGAIAGGPNHRLGGALAGGAAGGLAGHAMGSRMGGQAVAAEGKAVGQAAKAAPRPAAAPMKPQATPVTEGGRINQQRFQQHMDLIGAHKPSPRQPWPTSSAGPAMGAPTGGTPTVPLQKRAAWLPPFPFADDPQSAAVSGGSSEHVKTAGLSTELVSDAASHFHVPPPRRSIPGLTAVVPLLDDAAQIGSRKMQGYLNRRMEQQPQHEKEAGVMGAVGKRALQSAAGWGAAGAVTGAITAKPGNRMHGAMVGGLAGAAGGAVAPAAEGMAGRMLKMSSPYDDTTMFDMKQRAAEKYPEKVSPIESIRTDAKNAIQLLQDKLHDIRGGFFKEAFDVYSFRNYREKIAAEAGISMGEVAHAGGMPKQLMTARGAGFAGIGALIGGGMGYLGSRGKEEYGGKSKAEVELNAAKDRQPEKPNGIGQAVGKHVTNIHADVAEQMRKHPLAATLTGAGIGAGLALRISSMLGK